MLIWVYARSRIVSVSIADYTIEPAECTGPEVIVFLCSIQLSMIFIMLSTVKLQTIVGNFAFSSMINTT